VKIIILGAGITGLTTGYLHNKNADVTILEKSSRPGGWIQTINQDGFLFELGPRSCRPKSNGRYTLKLIEELGLTDQITTGHTDATKRYLFVNNKLQKLPTSPLSFITSSLTRPMALSLLKEPWISPSQEDDESIHSFISRRFGDYAANTFFNPLTLGIYAGDTHKLSIKSCFPNLHEWEQTHRSVIRGAFKSKPVYPITSPFIESLQKQPLFTFKKGMQTLTDALAQRLDSNIRYNTTVTSIDINDKEVTVNTSKGSFSCDHLYLCIPAHQLTSLFPQIPTIETASVVTASIGYKHYTLKEQGFGHLVPASEKEKILGVVWDSSAFPEQNQHPQETRLTVMMGGAQYPDLINESKQTLETLALDALNRHLGITTCPDTLAIHYAKNAIPQYHVGHAQRVEEIERQFPHNITLLGNSFRGVAINDCIANAYQQ
jgi:protoporphyrinogen/coproporphyrinogen III oxidase